MTNPPQECRTKPVAKILFSLAPIHRRLTGLLVSVVSSDLKLIDGSSPIQASNESTGQPGITLNTSQTQYSQEASVPHNRLALLSRRAAQTKIMVRRFGSALNRAAVLLILRTLQGRSLVAAPGQTTVDQLDGTFFFVFQEPRRLPQSSSPSRHHRRDNPRRNPRNCCPRSFAS